MPRTVRCLLTAALLTAAAPGEVAVTALEIRESRTKRLATVPGAKAFGGGSDASLSIELLLSGPEAGSATHVGEIVVEQATDDTGKSLKQERRMFGDGFDEIDRRHMWFMSDQPPKDKIKVSLDLGAPARAAGRLALVAGSLSLRSAESEELLVVPEAGREVAGPLLAEAGVKVSVAKVDAAAGSLELKVEGPAGKLGEIDWVDAGGESLVMSRSSFGFGKTRTVTLDTGGKSVAGAKLRIPVYTKVSTLKVPFKLENLELP